MPIDFDISKTLDELEGRPFGPPIFPSGLVTTVCSLYKDKAVRDFEPGDLRIIIGQKFSLRFMVPLALEALAKEPWVEGTFFPGDLLQNVVSVPSDYWKSHPAEVARMLDVIGAAIEAEGCETDMGVGLEIMMIDFLEHYGRPQQDNFKGTDQATGQS